MALAALEREICSLAADLAAATCRWLELVAEWDERLGWAEWGMRSCAHWLSWRCSVGLGTAREHVRVARALKQLPRTRGSFRAGQLSYCKVRALSRVATPDTEESLLELARNASGAQLEAAVRGLRNALDATSEQAVQTYERRELYTFKHDDGSLRVELRLPPEDGAAFLRALQAAEEALAPAEQPQAPSPTAAELDAGARSPSPPQRRADAFLELTTRGVQTELVVHVDLATLAAERIVERCEVEDGPALAPETLRRLGCDAALIGMTDRQGEPLSVGRRSRTVPPAIRRALRSRDRGCRFPGCTHSRFLHAHHIRHWARGGETSLENLVQLCSYHHHLVHEGGYTVEWAGGALRFRRPGGESIATAGRLRGNPLAVARENRRRGVEVDDQTIRGRFAAERLDLDLTVMLLAHEATRDGPPPGAG